MVAHLEDRAQKNHGQTLEQLAQRSGLDPSEMMKLLNNENLFPDDPAKRFGPDPDAEQKIMVMILEFLNKT